MSADKYFRQILALEDDVLERFMRDWVATTRKDRYHEVQIFSGPQDLGRDVVGFLSNKRHEGPWDNYQCKQFMRRRVPLADALVELAKIFYYADAGHYVLPSQYFFVAPHGLNRTLELLLDKPSAFKAHFLENWDGVCARRIADGQNLTLTDAVRVAIERYDFGNVGRISLAEILAAPRAGLVLHRYFGADPGPPPPGQVPADIQDKETNYVTQLLSAYGQRSGQNFSSSTELGPTGHAKHFSRQRERFFDADYFKRHYRDNTEPHVLPQLDREIHHGVAEVYDRDHQDDLECVDAVLAQAAVVAPSGPLATHAGVTVKQGICHHLVNDGQIEWKK